MIRLKDVSFGYKDRPAIRDLTLEIAEGEWVAILGANGSGKTTLGKLLSGVLLPGKGEVWVAGVNTKKQNGSCWSGVGLVLSKPEEQLIAPTVEEELAFGPENLGLVTEEIKDRVNNALSWLGLEDYARRPVNELSGGEQQRVALASVLTLKPRYLILDEPTAFLAPHEADRFWQLIHRLNKEQGLTVIWLSQRVEQARGADRVIALHQGKLCADDASCEIFSNAYNWQDWGLELPPVLRVANGLAAKGFSLSLPVFTVNELLRQLCD